MHRFKSCIPVRTSGDDTKNITQSGQPISSFNLPHTDRQAIFQSFEIGCDQMKSISE